MSVDGLAEFLLREIAADEAAVSAGDPTRHFGADTVGVFNPRCPACLAGWPGRDRFLAECEVKRRIVEVHTDATPGVWWCPSCEGEQYMPCQTVRLLALPYADHPGYREEWRP